MMPPRPAAAAAVLLALALAACGGPAAHPAATASPTVQQREQVSLDYARCLRQNGASVPDPTFGQDGSPHWAVDMKTLPAAQTQPCGAILQRLGVVSQKPGTGPSAVPALTQFSQCMRQHGMSDWPDPNPDGNGFPTRSDPSLDPAFQPAYDACRSLLPAAR
jgi:hypothetical protein